MRNFLDVVKQDKHLARPRNYSLFDELLNVMKPKIIPHPSASPLHASFESESPVLLPPPPPQKTTAPLQRLQSTGKMSAVSSSIHEVSLRRKSSTLKVTNIEFERPSTAKPKSAQSSANVGGEKKRVLTLSPRTGWTQEIKGEDGDLSENPEPDRPVSAMQVPHYHQSQKAIRVPSFLPGSGSVESNVSGLEKVSDSERINTLIRDQSRDEVSYFPAKLTSSMDRRRQIMRLAEESAGGGKLVSEKVIERREDGEPKLTQKEIHMHVPLQEPASSQEPSLFAEQSELALGLRKLSLSTSQKFPEDSPFHHHDRKMFSSVHISEVASPSTFSEIKKIEQATSPFHSSQVPQLDTQRTGNTVSEEPLKRPTFAVLNKMKPSNFQMQPPPQEETRTSQGGTFSLINMDPMNLSPPVLEEGITPSVKPNPSVIDRQAIRRKLARSGSPLKQQELHVMRYKNEISRQSESANNSIRDGTSRLEAGPSASLPLEPQYSSSHAKESSPTSNPNQSPRQRVCLFQAGKLHQNGDINEESDSNFESVLQNTENYTKLSSPKHLILQGLLPVAKQQDLVSQILALTNTKQPVETFRTDQPPTMRDERFRMSPEQVNSGFIRFGGNQALIPINPAAKHYFQNQVNFYEIRPVAPIKRQSRPSTRKRKEMGGSSGLSTVRSLRNILLQQEGTAENSVMVSAEFGGGSLLGGVGVRDSIAKDSIIKDSVGSSRIIPIIRKERPNSKINSDIASSTSLRNSAVMSENRKSRDVLQRSLQPEDTHAPPTPERTGRKDPDAINEIAVGLSYRYLSRRSNDPPNSGKSGVYLPGGCRTAPELVHSLFPPSVLAGPPKQPIPTVNINEMLSSRGTLQSAQLPRRKPSPGNIVTENYRLQMKKKYFERRMHRIEQPAKPRGQIQYLLPHPSLPESPKLQERRPVKTAPCSVTSQVQQHYKSYENFRISNSRLSSMRAPSNILEVPTVNAAVGLAPSMAPSHYDDEKSELSLHVKGVGSLDSTKRKDSASPAKKSAAVSPITKRMSMMEFRRIQHLEGPSPKKRPDSAGFSIRSRSASPPNLMTRTFHNLTSFDHTSEELQTPLESRLLPFP